jgi:hypothetical protein
VLHRVFSKVFASFLYLCRAVLTCWGGFKQCLFGCLHLSELRVVWPPAVDKAGAAPPGLCQIELARCILLLLALFGFGYEGRNWPRLQRSYIRLGGIALMVPHPALLDLLLVKLQRLHSQTYCFMHNGPARNTCVMMMMVSAVLTAAPRGLMYI